MPHALKTVLLGLIVLLWATPIQAQTIDISTSGSSSNTSAGADYSQVGQRILPPGTNPRLRDFSLTFFHVTGSTTLRPFVAELTTGTATGSAPLATTRLWTGNDFTLSTYGEQKRNFAPPTPIAMDTSKIYVIGVEYVSG